VGALVGASGCDLVFPPGNGPGGPPVIDAPGDDDGGASAPDADLSTLCPQQTPLFQHLDALADADITVDGVTNTGLEPVVAIDGTTITYGLFKFDISGLPPDPPAMMTLTLRYAETACSPGCSSCAGGEVAGGLLAFALVSDWQETEVTWVQTGNGGRIWNGASGLGDHSVSSATVLHAAGAMVQFTIAGNQAIEFWQFADQPMAANRFSFLVEPNAQTAMRVAARDGEGVCAMVPRASLDLVFCMP
jgi:hypothetical protein